MSCQKEQVRSSSPRMNDLGTNSSEPWKLPFSNVKGKVQHAGNKWRIEPFNNINGNRLEAALNASFVLWKSDTLILTCYHYDGLYIGAFILTLTFLMSLKCDTGPKSAQISNKGA